MQNEAEYLKFVDELKAKGMKEIPSETLDFLEKELKKEEDLEDE